MRGKCIIIHIFSSIIHVLVTNTYRFNGRINLQNANNCLYVSKHDETYLRWVECIFTLGIYVYMFKSSLQTMRIHAKTYRIPNETLYDTMIMKWNDIDEEILRNFDEWILSLDRKAWRNHVCYARKHSGGCNIDENFEPPPPFKSVRSILIKITISPLCVHHIISRRLLKGYYYDILCVETVRRRIGLAFARTGDMLLDS